MSYYMFDNIQIQGEALASKIYLSSQVASFAFCSNVASVLSIFVCCCSIKLCLCLVFGFCYSALLKLFTCFQVGICVLCLFIWCPGLVCDCGIFGHPQLFYKMMVLTIFL